MSSNYSLKLKYIFSTLFKHYWTDYVIYINLHVKTKHNFFLKLFNSQNEIKMDLQIKTYVNIAKFCLRTIEMKYEVYDMRTRVFDMGRCSIYKNVNKFEVFMQQGKFIDDFMAFHIIFSKKLRKDSLTYQ